MGGGASTNVHNQENKPMKDLGPEFQCRLITKINDAKDVILRIGPESLSILDPRHKLLKVFPHHQIICWGHNAKSFRWKIALQGRHQTFAVMTNQGKQLEQKVLSTVKQLMKAMETKGVDDPAFNALLNEVKHKGVEALLMQSRPITAHQAVQMVQSVEDDFVRFETAVAIYDRLINKSSFQLVLNEFENKADRENLCLRLNINFEETGISTEYADGFEHAKTTASSPSVTSAQESYSTVKCDARSECPSVNKEEIGC